MADTTINRTLELTFAYTGTDFQRTYKIDEVDESALETIKSKILAINASLKAGTDDGLAEFFISDDFDDSDPNNVIGKFRAIVDAELKITESETLSKILKIYFKEG